MTDTVQIALITGLTAAVPLIIGQVLTYQKSKQTEAKVSAIEPLVVAIQKSTDGAMTLQKKALAEVTAAKFAVTKSQIDKVTAEAALQDYLDHVALKTKQNGGHPPTPP